MINITIRAYHCTCFQAVLSSLGRDAEEPLLEGHVQGADGLFLLPVSLQVVNGLAAPQLAALHAVAVVVAVDALESLQLPHDVHGVPLDEGVLCGVLGLKQTDRRPPVTADSKGAW